MSGDILKPINNIKTFINENDQVLWECEASAKCYKQTSEKLKEECQRLDKEIAIIEEEIRELHPQIEILSTCYDVQVECLTLNQESLVNERLYKKRVNENIKNHQEEVNRTIGQYSQHFEKCKEKLEITNPAYKSLQTKRTELMKCKIRCLDKSKKLIILQKNNQKKVDIRKKLFNGDIVSFAESWLKVKRYFEATYRLNKEKQKEREHMKKLVEVTEQLKQKQKEGYYRKETSFKIPQVKFSRNELFNYSSKETSEKAKRQIIDPFSDLKKMLDKRESTLVDKPNANKQNSENQNSLQKIKFNANNSKIRILENKTVNQCGSENTFVAQSKEERSRAITEKLQKVVQNFNKSTSRQNSKQAIATLSQLKSVRCERQDISDKKCGGRMNASQESNNSIKMDADHNVQYNNHNGSGATQDFLNLSIVNQNKQSDFRFSQDSNKSSSQLSNDKGNFHVNLNAHRDSAKTSSDTSNFFTKPIHNTFSQEQTRLPMVSSSITSTPNRPVYNFGFTDKNKPMTATRAPQPPGSNQKLEIPYFGEKSQFFSGCDRAFDTYSKNIAKGVGDTTSQTISIFKKTENTGLEIPKIIEQNATEPMETISQSESTSKRTGESVLMQNTPFTSDQSGNESTRNLNRKTINESQERTENTFTEHENFMKMGGMLPYNFGNQTNTGFSQNINESYDYDYDVGYMSPELDQNFISAPSAENNIPMKFGNQSNLPGFFSFENLTNTFSFK